jgi:hypothetical protein
MSSLIYYSAKVLLSAVLIVAISEGAKRSTFFGALLASIPLTSVLAIVWLYVETGNTASITSLSVGIFWLVIPSLLLFLLLPVLLKLGLGFWLSLLLSLLGASAGYLMMVHLLAKFNVTM